MTTLVTAPAQLSIDGQSAELRIRGAIKSVIKLVSATRLPPQSSCEPQTTETWFPTYPGTVLPTAPPSTVNPEPLPPNSAELPESWDPDDPDLCLLFQDILPVNTSPTYAEEQDATVLSKPYNEIVNVTAAIRAIDAVTVFNYALLVEYELDSLIRLRSETEKEVFVAIEPSTIFVEYAAASPIVAAGASASPVSIGVEVAIQAAAVATGTSVQPVAIGVTTALGAVVAPRPELSISTGQVAIEVSSQVPTIATGGSAVVPSVGVEATTKTPKAGGILREAFDLTLLVEDGLLNLNV